MTTPSVLGHAKRIAFEPRDLGIFSIPEPRTRLDALQKYFFPRLDALLSNACRLPSTRTVTGRWIA